MRIARFYYPDISVKSAILDPTESHHLQHVLRIAENCEIEVFDGQGRTGKAITKEITKKHVKIDIYSVQTHSCTHVPLVLAVSVAKGQRFEWIIEKCTELGAQHIIPVIFQRTVKHSFSNNALTRYKKIAISATKQSGRPFLPEISPSLNFKECMKLLQSRYSDGLWIYGGFSDQARSLSDFLYPQSLKSLINFVGPEGGFTASEIQSLEDAGGIEVCINQNTLRIETAAVAFTAISALIQSP